MIEDVEKEIVGLIEVKSEFVVGIVDVFREKGDVWMMMEVLEGGTMRDWLGDKLKGIRIVDEMVSCISSCTIPFIVNDILYGILWNRNSGMLWVRLFVDCMPYMRKGSFMEIFAQRTFSDFKKSIGS
jgi:serine/threonine protein kinase